MERRFASRVALVAVFMMAVATLLLTGAAARAGTTQRTMTPEEQSALPTLGPDDMVPDEVIVQFTGPVAQAQLSSFTDRFKLAPLRSSEIGHGEPFHLMRILDGSTPPSKCDEIVAADPLIASCAPNVIGHLAQGAGPERVSPPTRPTFMTPPPAEPVAVPQPRPFSSLAPGTEAEPKGGGPDLAVLMVGSALAGLALAGVVFVLGRRRLT